MKHSGLIIVYRTPQAENPNASHAGLGITAFNNASALGGQAVPIIDGYYLRDGLRDNKWGKVTHCALSAPFFDNGFLVQLLKEFPHIHFTTVYHSQIPFLATDFWAYNIMLGQLQIQREYPNYELSANHTGLFGAVSGSNNRCLLLPNIYPIHHPQPASPYCGGEIHLGAFGAARILKNLPSCVWIAAGLRESEDVEVTLSVNAGRAEGPESGKIQDLLRNTARALNVQLNEIQWDGWEGFRNHLKGYHILLQPSLTETFNNVTADGLWAGVPSVVGPCIDWIPQRAKARTDDVKDNIKACESLLYDIPGAVREQRRRLERRNEDARRLWDAWFIK